MSYQKFIGLGRLTKDVELKNVGSENKVANFTLAIQRGNDKEKADFINCTAWNKTAENMVKYTKKGSMVLVEGEVHIDQSNDNFYTKVNCSNVRFISSPNEKPSGSPQQSAYTSNPAPSFRDVENIAIDDDDLPY